MRLAALSMVVIVGVSMSTGCSSSESDGPSAAEDEAAIRAVMDAWPPAIARGDTAAACDLFAKDVLLVYPGQPDRNWEEQCDLLGGAIAEGNVRYDPPAIDKVKVDGDVAMVSVTWTAHVDMPDGTTETEVERGLDAFERGDDGVWRITVSHAFPEDAPEAG